MDWRVRETSCVPRVDKGDDVKRSGPIDVRVDAEWSRWRDVTVPIDEALSMEEHLLLERTLSESVLGFQSMPMSPLGRMVMLTINQPREDREEITREIDAGIESARRMFKAGPASP